MSHSELIKCGEAILKNISSGEDPIKKFKSILTKYQFREKLRDDVPAWLTCVLALKAVTNGNLGIGSIILDNENSLVSIGYNQVFSPHFRSDGHAEMIAMDVFEKENKAIDNMGNFKIYTSLESCPMCMTRLIVSGIKKIYHLAGDKTGGMVHLKENLPPLWVELLKNQIFQKAKCSRELVKCATEIFLLNREILDRIFFQRRGE